MRSEHDLLSKTKLHRHTDHKYKYVIVGVIRSPVDHTCILQQKGKALYIYTCINIHIKIETYSNPNPNIHIEELK